MRFYCFNSQTERREFGGSAFVEFQFCKMPAKSNIKTIVSVEKIEHWQEDSLYVYLDDMEAFYKEYAKIFSGGTYNNMKTGVIDLYGINYYPPSLIDRICESIITAKPADCEALLQWLHKAKQYNGFYILGI